MGKGTISIDGPFEVEYLRPIDTHVHLRWMEYEEPFLEMAVEDAEAVDLAAMLAMPNTIPTLNTPSRVSHYVRGARARSPKVAIHAHVGVIPDPSTWEDSVAAAQQKRGGIESIKGYLESDSTGNIGIKQRPMIIELFDFLAKKNYTGVFVIHSECERCFAGGFNPDEPITHSLDRRPEAEPETAVFSLETAARAGFKGSIVFAHTSNPATVHAVESLRPSLRYPVYLEASPHHFLLNHSAYARFGLDAKINPPLREQKLQEGMLDCVLAGRMSFIGTDHAPHPPHKKTKAGGAASGTVGIPVYPYMVAKLREYGISERVLDGLLFGTANRVFELGLQPRRVKVRNSPHLWMKYGQNIYS